MADMLMSILHGTSTKVLSTRSIIQLNYFTFTFREMDSLSRGWLTCKQAQVLYRRSQRRSQSPEFFDRCPDQFKSFKDQLLFKIGRIKLKFSAYLGRYCSSLLKLIDV